MMRKLLCAIGLHKYMDLQRDDERLGQNATEECICCQQSRSVFRPFWGKEGAMHPRVQRRAV